MLFIIYYYLLLYYSASRILCGCSYRIEKNWSLIFRHIFFFFKKNIYFDWGIITLKHCDGFSIHQHELATGMSPHPELPSHHPLHPILLGCYRASTFGAFFFFFWHFWSIFWSTPKILQVVFFESK